MNKITNFVKYLSRLQTTLEIYMSTDFGLIFILFKVSCLVIWEIQQ